jgi:polysaccharide biosynthesis/export protein
MKIFTRYITVITFKSFLMLAVILSSANVFSQAAISKEFLEGLDPSIRDQIESENEETDEGELEELFRAEISVEKNKAILKSLRKKMDSLEKRMESDDTQFTLERFGDSFFSTIQSSFMPINIPNFSSNYIVDVGDTFSLLLTGKMTTEELLEVQRDGFVSIPKIGKVNVAGKSLADAISAVESFIETTYIGVKSYLSLSKVRDVQILVLGGIERPGIYTLSGGSSVLGALNVSGGISKNGSYRKIELRRGGETIEIIDLYDVFILGKYNISNTLRSGDTIFVHQSQMIIPVTGGANNPHIFEALTGESAGDLIRFAGGFADSFFGFNSIGVKRTTPTDDQTINVNINQIEDFKMQPRDMIYIPFYNNEIKAINQVTISGMVKRPGKYFISDGETLSNLINRAGGYAQHAYVYGSALFREDAVTKEQLYAEVNYAETVNYIVSNIGKPNVSLNSSALELLVEELKSKNFTGRIVTNFNTSQIKAKPSLDVTLQNNDSIIIPSLQKIVYMFGDFKMPSNIIYDSGFDIGDYISAAGGLKESSYGEIIVIDPDGKTQIYTGKLFSKSRDISIYPGSIIYAPRDIGKLSGLVYASTISPVLSNLALSLASLNSIQN